METKQKASILDLLKLEIFVLDERIRRGENIGESLEYRRKFLKWIFSLKPKTRVEYYNRLLALLKTYTEKDSEEDVQSKD